MSEFEKRNASKEIHHGNQFKTIAKYGPWYLLTTILTKMTALILMPVYTKYLSPHDYGILNTLTAFGNVLPLFISLCIDSSFGRYYFHEKQISLDNVKELYSTLFWFIVIWGCLVTTIALVSSPYLFRSLVEIPYYPYIPLTILPMLLVQLTVMGSTYLRSTLQTRLFATINLTGFVISTATILILLVPLKMGIQANLYGAFAGSIITLGFYLYFSIRFNLLGFCFSWKMMKRSLVYSLPLLPALAGSWISGLSDRLILSYYGRVAEVGLYSISAAIARLVYFANDAITQVQGPIVLSALTEDREAGKKQIAEFLSVFIWGIMLFYLLLTFFSKEIVYFFANERYHSSYKLVGILGFAYVLGGIYRPFMRIISFHAKTWLLSAAAILSAVVNGILNFAFIPLYGQYAAAWSTLFSMVAFSLWVIWWGQKLDRVPLKKNLVICTFTIGFSLLFLQQLIDYTIDSLWLSMILKALLIFVYILSALILKPFAEIKQYMLQVTRKLRQLRAER